MDKLTHLSIINCIKELDALKMLVLSEEFTFQELADWVAQISWHMSEIFRRHRYDSDEFQHRLRKFVKERKRRQQREQENDE